MGSDMVVALGPATVDGQTLFGHNSGRPVGETQHLRRVPGRCFPLGEKVRAQFIELPQVRQTFTVLGSQPDGRWGYEHGVNDQGVAVGLTRLRTRLRCPQPGLWGTDLVRNPDHRRWLADFYHEAKQIDPYRLIVDNSACAPNLHVAGDLEDYHHYRAIPDHAAQWDEWVADFARRADWVWAQVHPTHYHHLTGERGWSPAATRRRLTELVERDVVA